MNVFQKLCWAYSIRGKDETSGLLLECFAWSVFMAIVPLINLPMVLVFLDRLDYYRTWYDEVPSRVYWSIGGFTTVLLIIGCVTWPIAFKVLRNTWWLLLNPYAPRFCLYDGARKEWLKGEV